MTRGAPSVMLCCGHSGKLGGRRTKALSKYLIFKECGESPDHNRNRIEASTRIHGSKVQDSPSHEL